MKPREVFERFMEAMYEKYQVRVSKTENTPEPWKDFDILLLDERLNDEIGEYWDATLNYYYANTEDEKNKAKVAMRQELVDIANFCMFLWAKLGGV